MAVKIQLRRDTLANWLKVDPVLMDGEPAIVSTGAKNPRLYDKKKIGDGVHKFSELPYQEGDIKFKDAPKGIDFCITDEQGNTILCCRNGHIQTKKFDSRKPFSPKKTVRALFIGNSGSRDHVTYMPYILKNDYPDIDFHLYIFYIGGFTLKDYVGDILSGGKNAEEFSFARNTTYWTNQQYAVTLTEALEMEDWDIISLQGYYNYLAEDADCVSIITQFLVQHTRKSFELAWLMHQTYKDALVEEAIINGAKQAIVENPVSLLFSPFYATQLAKNIMGQSVLTSDGMHNNEGLPCMLGAYHIISVLARWMGIPNKTLGSRLRMTSLISKTLQIPGANGSVNDDLKDIDYLNCQSAAIRAVTYADTLRINAIKW